MTVGPEYNVDQPIQFTPTLSLTARQLNGLLDLLAHFQGGHQQQLANYPEDHPEHIFHRGAKEALFSLGEALALEFNQRIGGAN